MDGKINGYFDDVYDAFNEKEDATAWLTNQQLYQLFDWQHELVNLVVPDDMNRDHVAKLMVGCVLGEAAEANAHFLNETKPWKPSDPDWEAVDEEMIDVLHFLLEYFIMRNIEPTKVAAMYRNKNLVNQERVRSKMQIDGGTH